MNKSVALLGLLIGAPFLMANSPAPFAYTDTYEEVTVSNFSEAGNFIFFDLTNTGDKYVCEGDTMAPIYGYLLRDDGYEYVCRCNPVDHLFENQGLAPGMTERYFFEFDGVIDYSRITGFKTDALRIRDENVTYSNPTFTKTGDRVYTFNAEITGKGDYYYTTVIDVTYDEKDYCFSYSDWRSNANRIETNKELDLDKFEIKDVKFFRSSNNTYKGSNNEDYGQHQMDHSSNYVAGQGKNNNNNGNNSNGDVYGKVAVDPAVPTTVVLIIVGAIVVMVAPIIITIVVSNKKRKK